MRLKGLIGCFLIPLATPIYAATFTVTSVASSGPGSFADTLALADLVPTNESVEIVFDAALFSQPRVIRLNSNLEVINRSMAITGPPLINGRPAVTLSGDTDNDGDADVQGIEFLTVPGSSSLEFRRLAFRHFTRELSGGAIRQGNQEPTELIIEACTFADNQSSLVGGGAIFISVGTLTANRSLFERNRAEGSDGGAIRGTVGGTMQLNRCEFRENHSSRNGGAVAGPASTIDNSYFDSNEALMSGGAVSCTSSITCRASTFTRNFSQTSGGAVVINGSSTVLLTALFDNCTFSENRSKIGGAMIGNYADSTLRHCTVVGNIANYANEANPSLQGGGLTIGSGNQAGRFYLLVNSIVADNSVIGSPNNPGQDLDGAAANYDTLGGCLIGIGSSFSSSLNGPKDIFGSTTAPLPAGVGPLQYNGGFTPTRSPYADSAAVNGGEGTPLDVDQRGQVRPSGSSSDKGAVEFRILNFSQWAALHLLPENAAEFLDDPDEDGQDNLLEYYTGLDPMRPSATAVRVAMGASNLQLEYPVADHVATGSFSAVFSRSRDLVNWQEAFPNPVELGREGNAIYQRANFAASTSSRFVRLGVTSPP